LGGEQTAIRGYFHFSGNSAAKINKIAGYHSFCLFLRFFILIFSQSAPLCKPFYKQNPAVDDFLFISSCFLTIEKAPKISKNNLIM
jgi:hypothetical protein